MTKHIKTNIKGIHNGEVTHHQDQSILSVNFSTKNTMNSTNGNDDSFIYYIFFISFKSSLISSILPKTIHNMPSTFSPLTKCMIAKTNANNTKTKLKLFIPNKRLTYTSRGFSLQ